MSSLAVAGDADSSPRFRRIAEITARHHGGIRLWIRCNRAEPRFPDYFREGLEGNPQALLYRSCVRRARPPQQNARSRRGIGPFEVWVDDAEHAPRIALRVCLV